MKCLIVVSLTVCLAVFSSCKSEEERRAEAEFKKKWEVVEQYLFAGRYYEGGLLLGLNLNDPTQRGVFRELVNTSMDFESRVLARIEEWSANDSQPTPPIYLDRLETTEGLRRQFERTRSD